MPPKKKLSPFEAIEQFTARLEQADTRPTINRWVPMENQKIFLQSQAKFRIAFGGNRAGKTAITTYDDVMILARKHPHRQHLYPDSGPLRMRVVGSDFERGVDQTLVPYFQQFLPPSLLVNGSWEASYRRAEHFLTLADGSTVSFMSYEQDPDKFQSVSLHHVHMDEEPPEAIYRESLVRLWDTAGTLTISETPVQQLEWMEDTILAPWREGKMPSWDVVTLRTSDNTHLPAAEIAEAAATMTAEERLIRLEGQYVSGKTKVFPEFTGQAPFVIPHQQFLQTFHADPDGWVLYESMDYGMVNPTAWIWTAVHQDGSIVTMHVRYAPRVVVPEWATIVKLTRINLAHQLGLSPDQFMSQLRGTFGDPAIGKGANGMTNTTIQQDYAMAGIYIGTEGIYQARGGNNNVGLDHMHKYLRVRPATAGIPASTGIDGPAPWWQITDAGEEWDHAQNQSLIDEMRKARIPKQTLKQQDVKNPAEQIRDKDNHAIDAQKYLFMVTHELRPARFADDKESDFARAFAERYGTPAAQPVEQARPYDDFDGRVTTHWDTYSSLED